MTVLGIDPGIAITGIAVVQIEKQKSTLKYCSAIITKAHQPLPQRLLTLYTEVYNFLEEWKPDVCAIEQLFFNTNTTTALVVGQARGVIHLALAQRNIPVTEYTPLQVKMAVTGYGRAEKKQIQQMIKQVFKLPTIISPDDASDAAAIALTHCFSYKLQTLTRI
jgi:crossover junction endodeoxyribonuclease RuvC